MEQSRDRLKELISRIESESERKHIELEYSKGNIRPLDKLVVSKLFSVDEVISQATKTTISPVSSDTVIGGRIKSYDGGQNYVTTLKVTPLIDVDPDNESPVRKLDFYGISPVRNGERISAKIPCYSTIEVRCRERNIYDDGKREVYIARALRPEETAIEIAIHSDKVYNSFARIDRSPDYVRFFPEK